LIKLQNIGENDFKQLINAIPDARFLLQWAGPKYTYPLDVAQLKDTLKKTNGEQPSFKVFKAIKADSSDAIGHIQLMDIDYNNSSCILGRVLVFSEYRGTGLAKELVNCAVEYAFLTLALQKITLNYVWKLGGYSGRGISIVQGNTINGTWSYDSSDNNGGTLTAQLQ